MTRECTLPMNPSLVSALSLHGYDRVECDIRKGKVASFNSQDASNFNTTGAKSIHAFTMHPSLPWIAYLAEETLVVSKSMSQSLPLTAKRSKSSAFDYDSPIRSTVKTQRIVVQKFDRIGSFDSHNVTTETKKERIVNLPMEHLPFQINRLRQSKMKRSKVSNQTITLAMLGPLKSIVFLDREALFWQTRRSYGSMTNDDLGSKLANENFIIHADSLLDSIEGGLGHGLCLGLQFTRVLAVIRCNNDMAISSDETSEDPFRVLCYLEGQQSGTGNGKESSSQYYPVSALIPITDSVIVYGCSDGAMRFHNLLPSLLYSSNIQSSSCLSLSTSLTSSLSARKSLKHSKQATIKSVRGPNGRNDPIVKIVNVDPAYNEYIHNKDDQPQNRIRKGQSASSMPTSLVLYSRLLTACSSGVAYLWDVCIHLDRSSGAVCDLIVDPPLVRIDGLGSLTVSPRKSLSNSTNTGGNMNDSIFWAYAISSKSSADIEAKAPYCDVVPSITYDPHRNLLLWALPSEAPVASIDHKGDFKLKSLAPNSLEARSEIEDKSFVEKWSLENGGFVKVWDLSLVNSLVTSSSTISSSPQPPPKFPPVAVCKLHPYSSSAVAPNSVVAGLLHSFIPSTLLTYTCLSKDGSELLIQAAPLPGIATSIDEKSRLSSPPASKEKITHFGKTKILFVNFTTYHSISSSNLLGKSDDMSRMTSAKCSALVASFYSPDVVSIVSKEGIIIKTIPDGESWLVEGDLSSLKQTSQSQVSDPALVPFHIPTGPLNTIISGGPVSSLNNRHGVLVLEDNTVYASKLICTRAADHKDFLVEKVGLQDPIAIYRVNKESLTTIRSTRIANFVEMHQRIKCLPRLIPSPSGRYLCLFWEYEMRYEILHAGSLLTKESGTASGSSLIPHGRGPGVSPSVDSENHILSFAWMGDDDQYAILRYVGSSPGFSSTSDTSSSLRASISMSGLSDPRREILENLLFPLGADRIYHEPDASLPTATRNLIRSHVELKKLAEVHVDAVELVAGATVAAATVMNLGRLDVRGGDRSIPTVLFGGPTLCVGCITFSNRSRQSNLESFAYFYSRSTSSIKMQDERASAYKTVGPSLPYPSLVSWDDEGKLCAMSLGSRVAVYLSDSPKFTLLGTISILKAKSSSREISLISLKFIHGVLYCSTQSSVHVVFLGNLVDEETVCETDVFTIATNHVPLSNINHISSLSPVPAITALMHPHILAYHSGGLLVSTSCGLRLLSLSHPMIRVGTLLAANLTEKAKKWIHATPKSDHDAMGSFLFRRGRSDLVMSDLDQLSIEFYIDMCITNDCVDELERLVSKNGEELISDIRDWKRGDMNGSYSAILCIGVYLIGKGRFACVKKWICQAIKYGITEILYDALKLALLLAVADKNEGKVLIQKAMDAIKFDAGDQVQICSVLK